MPTKKPIKKTKKTAKKVKSPPKSTKAVKISDITPKTPVKKPAPKPAATPKPLPLQPSQPPKVTRSKRKLVIVAGVITTALLIAGGLWVYLTNRQTISPQQELMASVSAFQPYYFANDTPPVGLTLDSSSLSYSGGVLFFSLKDPNNEAIAVSQQTVPEVFKDSVPEGNEQIETSYGEAGISLMPDRTIANLIADNGQSQTFILVSAPSKVSVDQVKTVVRNLQPFQAQ